MGYLPTDLIHEVLVRSPAKTVERWVSASSVCAIVVNKPSFSTDFHRLAPLLQESRGLFASRMDEARQRWVFRSFSLLEPKVLTACDCDGGRKNEFLNYSSGLVCSGSGERPIIYNPSNGGSRLLPSFEGEKEDCLRSFIGFHPTNGFNVLAVKKNAYRVHSFETMEWKPIEWFITPKPATSSVCINGIIHYVAYETPRKMVLMSFDLGTETFQINKIPQEAKLGSFFVDKTMNVNGKIGVCFAAGVDKHILWVLENQKEDLWSEMLIETPSYVLEEIDICSRVSFDGFIKSGEKVFSQQVGSSQVLYFCHGGDSRKHIYQGVASSQIVTVLQHIDSFMFI